MFRLYAAPAGGLVGRDQSLEQGRSDLGSQHGLTCLLDTSLLVPKPDRVGPSKTTEVFFSIPSQPEPQLAVQRPGLTLEERTPKRPSSQHGVLVAWRKGLVTAQV